MASLASEEFRELPVFTSDQLEGKRPGVVLELRLLEYLPSGGAELFNVRYTHRELIYRTEGHKDAVAFGVARIESGPESEVRILFSRPNQTATLKGAELEGPVRHAFVD